MSKNRTSADKKRITFAIERETAAWLDEVAESEDRPTAYIVRKILLEAEAKAKGRKPRR